LNEKEVVLAGIAKTVLALQKIAQENSKEFPLEVSICEVKINKQNPEFAIHTPYQRTVCNKV
jgi:pyrimidine operon attenuation protein/uracil phosphoribosyltransferase